MLIFFNLIAIVFLLNEVYYIFNKRKLDVKFKERDISATTRLDVLYYLLRFSFWCWVILGIFSQDPLYFIMILVSSLIKFPLFHISKTSYVVYGRISDLIRIVLLSAILIRFIS